MTGLNGDLAQGFVHEALMYGSDTEYVSGCSSFVEAALAADQPVLVAVPGKRAELIRKRLGGMADNVTLADMAEKGRNPGRIIASVLQAFIDVYPGSRVSIIGEPIWPGRTDQEYAAAVQHEALINLAFAGRQASILCPYDTAGLAPDAIKDAERTHPTIVAAGRRRFTSPAYADPVQLANDTAGDLSPPPPSCDSVTFSSVSAVRRWVSQQAQEAGLAQAEVADLTIAANEVATNSLVHADGKGVLRTWSDHEHFICDLRDAGHITDPLVGRVAPRRSSESGRGLILANFLCDLVRIRSDQSGTTVRLWMRLHSHGR